MHIDLWIHIVYLYKLSLHYFSSVFWIVFDVFLFVKIVEVTHITFMFLF